MRPFVLTSAISLPLLLALGACGGGDATGPDPAAAPAAAGPTASALGLRRSPTPSTSLSVSDQQRATAATATANSSANDCSAVRPFYWEIGNGAGKLVSGSLASSTSPAKYSATLPMSIASASKWIYGAYVAQVKGGVLGSDDRKFLAMRAGYTGFRGCDATQTVSSCLAAPGNGAYNASADGKFSYGGGHMEKHAELNGLGPMNDSMLTAAVKAQIGSDVALTYTQPQLAGGLAMSPDAYAKVLRKMMTGTLKIGALLGTGPVCTNPLTCGTDQALFAPIPSSESWHYSVAHWVEDDPVVGDGAFSSPGAFGFYPWIDKSKTYYGVLARVAQNGAWPSVQCGRLIRKAWLTGVAQ